MKSNQYNSLYSILGIIVTSVVVTVMSILLTYNYLTTKTQLTKELQEKSEISLNRINNSIAPFIESYSMNDYEKLLINEMNDKTIVAIVVDDYYSANVLGKENFYNGKIRDKNWNITSFDIKNNIHITKLKNVFLYSSDFALSSNLQKLGKVSIYYTDTFLIEELDALIQKSIITVFVISGILIIILFVSINKLILQPIQKIVDTLSVQNKQGIPLNNIIGKGSKEFTLLSTVINNMISTIKSSQQEINNLNHRFQLTLDAVNDGMWDWNILTDEAYFSKKWKSMLGYEEDGLEDKGSTFFNLIHHDDKDKVKELLKKHFIDPIKNKYYLKIRLKCKDNSYMWVLSRGKVLLDDKHNPIRMVGYHTDITIEKQQEEYIKQKDQQITEQSKLASMGEMIGNIAHQWRQPLSIISTGATGLQVQHEFSSLTTETINETCKIINDNAQYLSKTIDDFRNFIKDNKEKSKFKLSDAINSFITLTKGTAKNHNIYIELSLDDDIQLYSFENQFIQCCINIFNNSKDALNTCEDKYFFIKTFIKDNNTVIVFHDNAGGIKKDILPRIFEPYFTTKHKSQGTGLGLHITYSLISVGMNGAVSAQNIDFDHNGKNHTGIQFTLSLPMNTKF